jgi:hypothetical protein
MTPKIAENHAKNLHFAPQGSREMQIFFIFSRQAAAVSRNVSAHTQIIENYFNTNCIFNFSVPK